MLHLPRDVAFRRPTRSKGRALSFIRSGLEVGAPSTTAKNMHPTGADHKSARSLQVRPRPARFTRQRQKTYARKQHQASEHVGIEARRRRNQSRRETISSWPVSPQQQWQHKGSNPILSGSWIAAELAAFIESLERPADGALSRSPPRAWPNYLFLFDVINIQASWLC